MTTAYLKWIAPAGGEQVYVLSADEVLVGRKSDADIILPSPYVSRHHAILSSRNGGLAIADRHSKNGTFVNDNRLGDGPTALRVGDRIRIGHSSFEVAPGSKKSAR